MATCREIRASDALYLFNKVKRALDLGTFDQASLENVLLASKWEKRRLKLCEGFVLPGLTERR
jgi:hypothetical protein